MHKKIINRLFERRYRVRVPIIATYSDDELRVLGMPIRKVNNTKKKTDYGEFTLVELTVNEMVEIFKNGYPIFITDRDNITLIYKTIDQHLTNWRYKLSNTLHIPDYPEDDLKALDDFAHEIYDNNSHKVATDVYAEHNHTLGVGFDIMTHDTKEAPKLNTKGIKRKHNLLASKKKNYSLTDLL